MSNENNNTIYKHLTIRAYPEEIAFIKQNAIKLGFKKKSRFFMNMIFEELKNPKKIQETKNFVNPISIDKNNKKSYFTIIGNPTEVLSIQKTIKNLGCKTLSSFLTSMLIKNLLERENNFGN